MATTTSFLQNYPDYFDSNEDCISFAKNYNKIQSNVRYRNFCQTQFTCGDEEQFQKYRYDKNNKNEIKLEDISINDNLFFEKKLFSEWEKYKKLDGLSTINTFRYIFKKFKKGIFIKIVNNQLKVFLPFSNVNFINEWSCNIKIDPKYSNPEFPGNDVLSFFEHIAKIEGRKFNKHHVNTFSNGWYSNNCLIRYEFPVNEGDTNVSCFKNMLEELCENRQVPDIELFINRRDFPILSKDGFEPYFHLWDSYEKKLVSHDYEKYVPILSMSSDEKFSDILIPTYDDWIRVQNKENKFFSKASQDYNYVFDIKWEDKKDTAVFRGSSTGFGVTIKTNQRLNLAYLSSIVKPDENGNLYIDAGITKWNIRPKKIIGHKYLQTVDIENLPFDLKPKLTPYEQSQYKYVIHVDGHTSALRLSYELSMNSVVLIVKSNWKVWFSDLLKPYVHFIPVKEDLTDLVDIIKWCRKNDNECKEIAKNAKEFYDTYLQKNGIFDYLQKVFIDLKKDIGNYLYNNIKPIEIQIIKEYKNIFKNEDNSNLINLLSNDFIDNDTIENIYKTIKTDKPITKIEKINSIPNIARCYGFLRGIHNIIELIDFEEKAELEKEIFHNKLGIIRKYTISNFAFSIKSTSDSNKIKEHIHETFIGLNCINHLSEQIPNFLYIFGMYKKENTYNIITEYIPGMTLQEYIKSEEFTFYNYLLIIIQLCLALQYAQRKYGFVHYDLTVWNIMIHKLQEPINVDYIIDYGKVIRIKTNIVPIIIDYGKSHVFYNNEHYGFVNMYKFSTSADILSLLITSIYQIIIDQKLSKYDFNNFLKLANFISNSTFRKNTFKNAKDIRSFFYNEKKYSNLAFNNKYELEQIKPMDLFYYIIENLRYSLPYKYVFEYDSVMDKGNSVQIYNYILAEDKKGRVQSFIKVFNKIKKLDFKHLDSLTLVYFVEKIKLNLNSVYSMMLDYLTEIKVSSFDKYEIMYTKTIKYLESITQKVNIKLNCKNISIPIIGNYDENIFLFPKEVKKRLKDIEKVTIDMEEFNVLVNISHMAEFLSFSKNTKNIDYNMLSTVIVNTVNIANINSLEKNSKIIYDL